MKLTPFMYVILKDYYCESDKDIEQVQRACRSDILELFLIKRHKETGKREKCKISQKKALELLGEETFISGLDRAAFHWSCSREVQNINNLNPNYEYSVSFDCSKLFK